jgi:hypothetical protein
MVCGKCFSTPWRVSGLAWGGATECGFCESVRICGLPRLGKYRAPDGTLHAMGMFRVNQLRRPDSASRSKAGRIGVFCREFLSIKSEYDYRMLA